MSKIISKMMSSIDIEVLLIASMLLNTTSIGLVGLLIYNIN